MYAGRVRLIMDVPSWGARRAMIMPGTGGEISECSLLPPSADNFHAERLPKGGLMKTHASPIAPVLFSSTRSHRIVRWYPPPIYQRAK